MNKRNRSVPSAALAIISVLLASTVLLASCKRTQDTSTPETSDGSTTVVTEVTTQGSTSAETTTAPTSSQAETTAVPELVVLDPQRTNLRGELLPADEAVKRPVAVMLDNHPNARPQAGLRDADIVYEIEVEGGLTRYMAVFQSKEPEMVGPVRSARDAYLDKMLELDAIYVHIGGSKPSLDRISSEGIQTINSAGSVTWREGSTGKVAPHNVYMDVASAREYAARNGWDEEANYDHYSFYETDQVPAGSEASSAKDVFVEATSQSQTEFKYVESSAAYTRFKDGTEDIDENDGKPLEVKNIIVQKVKITAEYPNRPDLRTIALTGTGEGYYISMGQMIPITWKKDEGDVANLTRYYKEDGSELILNPGQTWIEVIGLDRDVKVIS